MGIRISMMSIFVKDQATALSFYTEKLGFALKHDVPLGEFRWLTLVAPDAPDGTELLLEPDNHPAAKAYSAALFADGIPAASFAVDDVEETYSTLAAQGVEFTQPPSPTGPVITAVLNDTCGNLVQISSPS